MCEYSLATNRSEFAQPQRQSMFTSVCRDTQTWYALQRASQNKPFAVWRKLRTPHRKPSVFVKPGVCDTHAVQPRPDWCGWRRWPQKLLNDVRVREATFACPMWLGIPRTSSFWQTLLVFNYYWPKYQKNQWFSLVFGQHCWFLIIIGQNTKKTMVFIGFWPTLLVFNYYWPKYQKTNGFHWFLANTVGF